MSTSVIDRIQKLLRLSRNAGSEHEAALAASRAAELMAQHEIHEAEISLDAATPHVAEPIERGFEVTATKKRVAWHMNIINGVAKTYGAKAYWSGARIVLFGRLSAVQAASYTAQYLMREVEALTDAEAPTSNGYSRAYRNAFRLGCAGRVANRLAEQAKAKASGASTCTDPVNDTETVKEAPLPSAGVIAIIERDHAEVEDAYAEFSRKWTRGVRIGNISSGSGYSAGQAAGNRIRLGGGRSLPRGQNSFKS